MWKVPKTPIVRDMATDVSAKIEQHFSQYPKRSYPKGQILIYAKEEPESIFFIASGTVRQYDISYRGDEIIVNVFKAGAFFPMLWALTKRANNYFFDAETAVEVHVAPVEDTLDFLRANPDVVLDLLTRVYSGIDGLLGRMVHLMSGSAQSRLLYELVIACRRFGQMADDGSCDLSLHESDLAARAGLSRETVSREMQKLHKEDLLRLQPGGIHINNCGVLEQKLAKSL